MEWKDITSYSMGQEMNPTSFEVKCGDFTIVITSGHIHYNGQWILSCSPFFDIKELNVVTEHSAKTEALNIVLKKIDEARNDLMELINEC